MDQTATNAKDGEKKPAISEAEVYFDSLLKSQEEDNSISKLRLAKLFSMGLLVLIIGAGLYFAVGLFINSNSITSSSNSTQITDQNNSGAYFNPEYYTNTERIINGKIGKNLNNLSDERMRFELLENNGKTIAYLISKNHDLNLSVGLQVEIQGELVSNTSDGREIIEVQSIKLK